MKTRIADQNTAAADLLPPNQPDGSGIGINHVDAFIKPFNTELENGTKIACKRKGLKLTLTVGEQSGAAVMNRINDGPDPYQIMLKALETAAQEAGSQFSVEDGGLYLEL